jgi:hypothetical protein
MDEELKELLQKNLRMELREMYGRVTVSLVYQGEEISRDSITLPDHNSQCD